MADKKQIKADIIAVAKAARVSPSTVSRCFNHPAMVNPATRKKVTRAVERLGYIRNRAAQTMHGRRSSTIGLIVPTINHAIFAEVIQAFSDAVDKAGFTVLITSHGYDLDREYAMLRKLLEHRVDGVALVGFEHTPASLNLIEQQDISTVAIWNYSETSAMSCVGADNVLAGRMAAEHLLSLGHRELGLVFPSILGNDRAGGRLTGALAVLAEYNVEVPNIWRTETPYSISQAKRVCIDLLTLGHRPTALLCGNDIIAQGAVFAAQHIGLDVPEEVSVIGIGDFKGSEDMEPGLTTIRIPAQSIGKIAGDRLTNSITSERNDLFRHSCDLQCIIRETVAPYIVQL